MIQGLPACRAIFANSNCIRVLLYSYVNRRNSNSSDHGSGHGTAAAAGGGTSSSKFPATTDRQVLVNANCSDCGDAETSPACTQLRPLSEVSSLNSRMHELAPCVQVLLLLVHLHGSFQAGGIQCCAVKPRDPCLDSGPQLRTGTCW